MYAGQKHPEEVCQFLILSYGASFLTVWYNPFLAMLARCGGVDEKIGDAAELLHRQFLNHILGVRDSTADVIVLAVLAESLVFPLVATNFAIP